MELGALTQPLDRRYEALVLVADAADALPATAPMVAALRSQGLAIAVIAPPSLRELAATFAPGSADVGTLLLGGDGGGSARCARATRCTTCHPAGTRRFRHPRRRRPCGGDAPGLARALGGGCPLGSRRGRHGHVPPGWPGDVRYRRRRRRGARVDHARGGADAGLEDARVAVAGTRITIGVEQARAAVDWALEELWNRGVAPAEVLVIKGDASADVGDVLGDQLRRRGVKELPRCEPVPGWSLAIDGFDVEAVRVRSTLLALADGRLGSSGAPLADPERPAVGVGVGCLRGGRARDAPALGSGRVRLPYELRSRRPPAPGAGPADRRAP